MNNYKLAENHQAIWELAKDYYQDARPGDDAHALQTAELVMEYDGKIELDLEVLIPVALMHDIGHAAILSEHFEYITGPRKIENAKLTHMLAGAKIASDILKKINYDAKKTQEIIDIIATHDFDQIKNTDIDVIYDTVHKKVFHDIDSLDRYNEARLSAYTSMTGDNKNYEKILLALEAGLENFFHPEIQARAQKGLLELKKKYKREEK